MASVAVVWCGSGLCWLRVDDGCDVVTDFVAACGDGLAVVVLVVMVAARK